MNKNNGKHKEKRIFSSLLLISFIFINKTLNDNSIGWFNWYIQSLQEKKLIFQANLKNEIFPYIHHHFGVIIKSSQCVIIIFYNLFFIKCNVKGYVWETDKKEQQKRKRKTKTKLEMFPCLTYKTACRCFFFTERCMMS